MYYFAIAPMAKLVTMAMKTEDNAEVTNRCKGILKSFFGAESIDKAVHILTIQAKCPL
jgi:hypothetical protein